MATPDRPETSQKPVESSSKEFPGDEATENPSRHTAEPSWRQGKRRSRGQQFRLRKLLALFVPAVFLVLLAVVLFRPFAHPRTHLLTLTGMEPPSDNGRNPLDVSLTPFAVEDLRAFDSLAPVLYQDESSQGPVSLRTVEEAGIHSLGEAIAEQNIRSEDNLLLYVRARGVSEADQAVLVWNLEPEQASLGRFRLRDLLSQLADVPAAEKIVLLDAGDVTHDPRRGIVVNAFPEWLKREVERTGDSRLWVLSSHRILEQSQVSLANSQTLFGLYVARALRGEADLNSDHKVDLDELHRFVSASIQGHVHEKSDGNANQTPELFWGGGTSKWRFKDGQWPVLVPVVESVLHPVPTDEAPTEEKPPSRKSAFEKAARLSPLRPAAPSASSAVNRLTPAAPVLPVLPPAVARAVPTPKSPAALLEEAAKKQLAQASPPQDVAQDQANKEQPSAMPAATNPPAGTPTETPSPAPTGGSVKEPEPVPQTVPELFSKVWELRDRLSSHESSVPRPLDYAPHLWRAFEEETVLYERFYLSGEIADHAAIASALGSWIHALERLAEGQTDLPVGAPDLSVRIAALFPQNPFANEQVFSLGMAELRGRLARAPLAGEVQSSIEVLDEFTTEGTPAEFVEWLGKLPESYQQYQEIRLAYQLRDFAGRDWPLVQLALRTRRQAEQVPALDLGATAWISDRLVRADRARWEGERELLDQASRGWRERAAGLLQSALAEYELASEDVQTVQAARILQNELLHRLPSYIRWWHVAGDRSGPSAIAPGAGQLATLIKLVSRQAELLENPASDNLAELGRLSRELLQLQGQIEAPLRPDYIAELTNGPAANGDEWRIRVLLETPLPNREVRMQLLGALWSVDEQLVSQLTPAIIPKMLSTTAASLTASERERLAHRGELDTLLAELAALHPLDDAGATLRVRAAFDALNQVPSQTTTADSPVDVDLLKAYGELGAVLRDFYSTLPGRIGVAYRQNEGLTDEVQRSKCLCGLKAMDRCIRLVDARDAARMSDVDSQGLLRRAEAADLLAWQYARLNENRYDADALEAQYLLATAQIYRNSLMGLPCMPPAMISPSPLELDVESSLSLPIEGTTETEVAVTWNGLNPAPVWLVLKYDSDLMEVSGDAEVPTYHEDRLREQGLSYPFRPPAEEMPATGQLNPGETLRLRFRVRAKTQADQPTQLIVKAVTKDQYIRDAIEVLLPFPELFQVHLGGTPGSWSPTAEGLTLYPYPNQETAFQLRLSSEDSQPRLVDVELSALTASSAFRLPRAALSPDDAAEWLGRLGPRTPLAAATKLVVPAAGEQVEIAFPAEMAKPETPAPMPTPSPMNGNGAPMGDEKKAESPPQSQTVPIPNDLLLVLTDSATGRKILKRLQIAPQRPRRYLNARVGYNLDQERIEVQVQMKDRLAFSPNGVRITGELAEGLEPGWTAQLAGRLNGPNDVARLFVNVPEAQGRVVTLRLHADGYPRAFVFRVPCDQDSADLPEESDLHDVRILSPADGTAFPVPTEKVMVQFQVDAPHGTFQTQEDFVQVGIDRDRDRTFLGDDPLVFHNDRQVKNHWVKAAAGGWITLASAVDDFQVDVPTMGLENAEVNLLANLITPTKTSWSLPQRLVFDGVGPELKRPELKSGDATIGNVVTQGKDVEVSIQASDFAKSGVVKVLAGFDLLGLGQFGTEPPPLPAKRTENDRWTATLPTGELKPGIYVVLFQGTDRVGNKGDYISTKVEVISPEEAEVRKTRRTNVLTGVVLDGKTPAPKIKVTLTPKLSKEEQQKLEAEKKTPVVIAPTVTDDAGKFAFPNVQIGSYTLTIEGITRGLRRKQETPVIIPPPPTRLKPLEIRIDKPPAP